MTAELYGGMQMTARTYEWRERPIMDELPNGGGIAQRYMEWVLVNDSGKPDATLVDYERFDFWTMVNPAYFVMSPSLAEAKRMAEEYIGLHGPEAKKILEVNLTLDRWAQ